MHIGIIITLTGFLLLIFGVALLGVSLCLASGMPKEAKKIVLNFLKTGYIVAGIGLIITFLAHYLS